MLLPITVWQQQTKVTQSWSLVVANQNKYGKSNWMIFQNFPRKKPKIESIYWSVLGSSIIYLEWKRSSDHFLSSIITHWWILLVLNQQLQYHTWCKTFLSVLHLPFWLLWGIFPCISIFFLLSCWRQNWKEKGCRAEVPLKILLTIPSTDNNY